MVLHTELALYAGRGGSAYAAKLLGRRIVCYVEREPDRAACIVQRIADGIFDDAPIWPDADTFDGRPWRGRVHCVTAGFPCQPFSSAGERKGAEDERNGWPTTLRIIREVEPRVVLLENVAALLTHEYAGTIFGQLAESGYCVRWDCIPALALGAPHRRDRLWIVAHAQCVCGKRRGGSGRLPGAEGRAQGEARERERGRDAVEHCGANVGDSDLLGQREPHDADGADPWERPRNRAGRSSGGCNGNVGHASGFGRREGWPEPEGIEGRPHAPVSGVPIWPPGPDDAESWRRILTSRPDLAPTVESAVRRVAPGLADRRRELSALGDGWVPVVAAAAFKALGGDIR